MCLGYAHGPYVSVICYGDHSQCREEVVEPPRWCFWGGLGWGVGTSARDQKGGCRDFRILEKTTSPFFLKPAFEERQKKCRCVFLFFPKISLKNRIKFLVVKNRRLFCRKIDYFLIKNGRHCSIIGGDMGLAFRE